MGNEVTWPATGWVSQFIRLIAEMAATQDKLDVEALCESMDLEPPDVAAIFDAAQSMWDHLVKDHAQDAPAEFLRIDAVDLLPDQRFWVATPYGEVGIVHNSDGISVDLWRAPEDDNPTQSVWWAVNEDVHYRLVAFDPRAFVSTGNGWHCPLQAGFYYTDELLAAFAMFRARRFALDLGVSLAKGFQLVDRLIGRGVHKAESARDYRDGMYADKEGDRLYFSVVFAGEIFVFTGEDGMDRARGKWDELTGLGGAASQIRKIKFTFTPQMNTDPSGDYASECYVTWEVQFTASLSPSPLLARLLDEGTGVSVFDLSAIGGLDEQHKKIIGNWEAHGGLHPYDLAVEVVEEAKGGEGWAE